MDPLLPRTSLKILGLWIGLCILMASFMSSMIFGQTPTPIKKVIEAFMQFDETSTEHIIITTTRLSRAVIAVVIGASLAIAGALLQALTRNPLASPSIFGINAGALFFVVFATVSFSVSSLIHLMWFAFLGAGLASILVFLLGSLGRDGLSPIKIVLAGAALTALFNSFTQGLLVLNEQNLEGILFWLGGSVSGRSLDMLQPVLPFMIGAGVLSLFLGNSINILTSGEDIAKGLGQQVILVKLLMGTAIVMLAGGSVAVGGFIGFIGLIVPHIVRFLVGTDYRWIIPYCAIYGASLLLLADVGARFVIMPEEMPIGVMTAMLGAPFFIYMARRGTNK
ncbi:iron ABC transporter permease [Paenibacillus sp. 7124]|uniref:Iron ABC transporter permease n=1 Tax=Paenibacillus apii TaxID=1850370 RepID=A0A6M1PU95_9BACL|nr:iron ABC transporter permease [Paenibacillus apii]NGM85283.1 iron ABC transporter permease [Paenibacillus apii]NJJ41844.1 iron ABC transporter permease [Paenibacillus apii]